MHKPQGNHVPQEDPCRSVACRPVVFLPFLEVLMSQRLWASDVGNGA